MGHMSLKTKVTEINLVQKIERNETSSSFMMFLYLVPLDNKVILTLLFCKQLNMSSQRNVLTNLGNVSYHPDVKRYELLNSRSLNKKVLTNGPSCFSLSLCMTCSWNALNKLLPWHPGI